MDQHSIRVRSQRWCRCTAARDKFSGTWADAIYTKIGVALVDTSYSHWSRVSLVTEVPV